MKIVKNLLLFILILLASRSFDVHSFCVIINHEWSILLPLCMPLEILQLSYFPFIISFSRWKNPSLLSCSLYVSSISLIIFVALLWTFSSSTLFWGGEDHNCTQYSRWGQTMDLHSSIMIFVLLSILSLIFSNILIFFFTAIEHWSWFINENSIIILCWK